MKSPSSISPVRFGVFEFDPRTSELRKRGMKVKLLRQPLKLLSFLLGAPGQIRSREELQQHLWPADTFVDFEHNLNKAVHSLREALGDSATSPLYIETIAGQGYRFIPIPQETSWPVVKSRRPRKIESLAVLPFSSDSAELEGSFAGNQIMARVIDELSKISGLRVLAFNTVRHYKPMLPNPQQIGRELGVRGVVVGELVRRQDNLSLHVELIDVVDGTQVCGFQLRDKWERVANSPEQVANAISKYLHPILAQNSNGQSSAAKPTFSLPRKEDNVFKMRPGRPPVTLKRAFGVFSS